MSRGPNCTACRDCEVCTCGESETGLRLHLADVFDAQLTPHSYALVYADPPYAGCRARYARGRNSRQWGRNARADFTRELVARMEALRAPDGVCALSMSEPELRLLHLFPTTARVFPWVKPTAPPRPGIWPTFAWEPIVAWGEFPTIGAAPLNWLSLSARVKDRRGHESPKPDAFAEWVLAVTLGPRTGRVCELYAGTAPVARAAVARDCDADAVDLDDYLSPREPAHAADCDMGEDCRCGVSWGVA